MLKPITSITQMRLVTSDKETGRCDDFLFDDRNWVVRYMVADTHTWLPFGQKKLISPISLDDPNWVDERLPVHLTYEQIKSSPDIEDDLPVSKEFERKFFDYYGYGYYWVGSGLWGGFNMPAPLIDKQVEDESFNESNYDLRSVSELVGYTFKIHASEQSLGRVSDMIINTQDWSITYLVIKLTDDRKIELDAKKIKSVSWAERCVTANLKIDAIELLPLYDSSKYM